VFVVDGDGRITLWNRAAEKLLGHSARDAIGRPSCAIVRSDAGGPALCYRGCHAGLVSVHVPMQSLELRTRTRMGRPIRVTVSTLVLVGPNGRGPTVMHLLREATAFESATAGANGSRPEADASGDATLTRREIDVLRLMGSGLNTRAIAEALGVSGATVRNHVQSILSKLGVHSRLAAVAVAHRRRLI
jgi:PAS domain S-box-containing protein